MTRKYPTTKKKEKTTKTLTARTKKAGERGRVSGLNSILEVIVEAKFSASNWTEDKQDQLHKVLRRILPKIEARNLVGAIGAARAIDGGAVFPYAPEVQIWNDERTELLQFGPGVIIANSLRYTSASGFARVLESGLHAFVEVVKPRRVEHLSFRLINHFNLGVDDADNISLDKFFNFYASLPKGYRDVEGLQISFQSTLSDASKTAQVRGPIKLAVELRNAFQSDLTALANETNIAESGASNFLLDIETSCACEAEPSIELIREIVEQLHFAAMKSLRSIVRPVFLKKYKLKEYQAL